MFTRKRVVNYAATQMIRMVTSTPYYAQANGQVEVVNKTIIALVKKHIWRQPRNWRDTISQFFWAYQCSPRCSIGTTPYKPVFGHDAVLPIEVNLQISHVAKQCELPFEDYWNATFDELNELEQERIDALENIVQQKESMSWYYNCRVRNKVFQLGDFV